MRIIRTLIHSSDTIMSQLAYCTFIDHTLLVVSIETISRVCHCCMRATFYKYTHAQTVFTLSIVINRAEHARSIVIIKPGQNLTKEAFFPNVLASRHRQELARIEPLLK